MHQNNGDIDDAIMVTKDLVHLYEKIRLKQLEASSDSLWNALPDGGEFADKMRSMKEDMERLQEEGVDEEEIGDRMLDKYDGRRILKMSLTPGEVTDSDSNGISWESTAKQLAEEKKRLERKLEQREQELMEHYEEGNKDK